MLNEKTGLNKWDKLMMAITFAEGGEPETAREILDQANKKQKRPENQEVKRPELRA